MGRGDKKTKKGKMSMGSFGVTRLSRPVKKTAVAAVSATLAEPKAKAAPKAKAEKA